MSCLSNAVLCAKKNKEENVNKTPNRTLDKYKSAISAKIKK